MKSAFKMWWYWGGVKWLWGGGGVWKWVWRWWYIIVLRLKYSWAVKAGHRFQTPSLLLLLIIVLLLPQHSTRSPLAWPNNYSNWSKYLYNYSAPRTGVSEINCKFQAFRPKWVRSRIIFYWAKGNCGSGGGEGTLHCKHSRKWFQVQP